MMTIVTLEVTNKSTGVATLNVVNTIAEAKRLAVRLAGYAGWLDFTRIEQHSRDLRAENSGFVVDILV